MTAEILDLSHPIALGEPNDTVAVALYDLAPGQSLKGSGLIARSIVPGGHKVAIIDMPQGVPVWKCGEVIGVTTQDIRAGEWVHSHNVFNAPDSVVNCERFQPRRAERVIRPDSGFQGYRRGDGRVGTRNEIWVIASIGGATRCAERIAQYARVEVSGKFDGVHAITHPFGCSQVGDDLVGTEAILAGLACNPNAGGVLFVGLEANEHVTSALMHRIPPARRDRVRFLSMQSVEDEVLEGGRIVAELVSLMTDDRRELCHSNDLVVGLKCGVSDGFSGISSNPLIGAASDRVVDLGGTVLLADTPKLLPARHLLSSQVESPAVGHAMTSVFERFEEQRPSCWELSGSLLDAGVSTPQERAVAALKKAGRGPIRGVCRYSEQVPTRSGLQLQEAPENDIQSTTALVAAGANLVLFSTGRGTPLGCPVPTVKISSNTELAERKINWIDFDAGGLVYDEGRTGMEERFFELILKTASGKRTRNEIFDERQISIWQDGVSN